MRIYVTIGKKEECKHFDKKSAEEAVKRIYYTSKDGVEHHGAHWTLEQVLEVTSKLQFKECVTDYDKYVAFNAAYADLNKTLTTELIIETAYAFFFEDEDAPCNKIWLYMRIF
jgi:hypothetical protein|nr:MAG TPA: hypothetical protein [Caudoviricetes sp.]